MKLNVTLLSASYGWQTLLEQIGVPYIFSNNPAELPTAGPAVILSDVPDEPQRAALAEYVRRGGAILSEADTATRWPGIPTRTARIRYLQAGPAPLFAGIPHLDFPFRARVPATATHLPDQHGAASAAIITTGKGLHIILPSGFAAAMADHGVRRTNFHRAGGERYPSERVARVGKGGLRLILERLLVLAYHHRNLPFAFKWPFPAPTETIFGFRIDTDFAGPEEIEQLHACLRKHRLPATWFVETRSAANWIKTFAAMPRQEIGLHCYRHAVADSEAENLGDIARGRDILERADIRPEGYAAPFGEWHPALADAVEKSGFRYASEFTQGYDALPFFPALGDTAGEVLQIPIHPVSVGRLKWARHTTVQMAQYYLDVLRARRALREPAIFYHHPGQGHLAVFDTIFREVVNAGLPVMTMGEYAHWWRQRSTIPLQVTWEKNRLTVNGAEGGENNWLCVRYPGQPEQLFPLQNGMLDEKSASVTLPPPNWQPPDPKPLHTYTAQMLVHDLTWRYSRWKQKHR